MQGDIEQLINEKIGSRFDNDNKWVILKSLKYKMAITKGMLAVACGLPSFALAESPALEEIIVTAQKREQNVQETPLSIGVVGGERLEQFSIRTTDDLDNFVPGLVIQEAPQNLSSITIRGVGTAAGSETFDQSVSLFIDGVFAGRQREFQTSLFDIERIEVIKGTQNTLLGKNTSLGAISLVTKKPGYEYAANIETNYELEHDGVGSSGAVDIPMGDLIRTRVAFNIIDDSGYVANHATGRRVPQRDQNTMRITSIFEASDDVEVEFMFQYDELEIIGDPFQVSRDTTGLVAGAGAILDPTTVPKLDDNKSSFVALGDGGESTDRQNSHRGAINVNWEMGEYALTSISAWSNYTNDRIIDSDFVAGDFLITTYDTDFQQLSQEFRITSPLGENFDFIAGAFYLKSDYTNINLIDANFPLLPRIPVPIQGATTKIYTQETDSVSIFGQGTYHFDESMRLTLGARWTDEGKDAEYASVLTREGPGVFLIPRFDATPLSRREEAFDGSWNVQWDWDEDTMIYLSWAQGTKSGGFTDQASLPIEAEYEDEIARTKELGMKATLLDGAATLNLAIFDIDIRDFQVVTFNGLGFDVDTVPASSRGIELDGFVALSPQLILRGGLTYSRAEQRAMVEVDPPVAGEEPIVLNVGYDLPRSPKLTGSLGLRYENNFYIPGLVWSVDTFVQYRDAMFHQLAEVSESDSYYKYDLRFGVRPVNYGWEVALIGRNVFDKTTAGFGAPYPLLGDFLGSDQLSLEGVERLSSIALQATFEL